MGLVNFLVYLAIMMGIYGILSLSLNLQYGFTGLANFGQVAFFCLGAYTSTIIVLVFKMPFFFGLLGAMVYYIYTHSQSQRRLLGYCHTCSRRNRSNLLSE
jgi:ABC-type branched-subunit amino acid transport system permease subunit